MTDTSDSFAPRSSRTTPEAIAERTFSQVKRGYAESEVRAYLRMVSSDFATAASRERELTSRIRDLEEQLRRPVLPPSDQDLIAALGEETARVLGQARESAIELKNKAEEHARRVVREAQETARELRTTTQQAVEAKTREAEDAARARAKEIVGEARGLRERVLTDLEERRKELERQIAELRAGRGKLVETYELVERALGHAARVMAEEPSTPPDVPEAPHAPETADDAAHEPPAASDAAPTAAAPRPPSRGMPRSPTPSRTWCGGASARSRTSRTTSSTACAVSAGRSTPPRSSPGRTTRSPGGPTSSSPPSTPPIRGAPPPWRVPQPSAPRPGRCSPSCPRRW
jgi:DivIVA domain-containing protein